MDGCTESHGFRVSMDRGYLAEGSHRFKVGDAIWKPSWPQQAGTVAVAGYMGHQWLAYLIERPDGKQAVIFEDEAERAA